MPIAPPTPSYYAVIFTNLRTEGDHGYAVLPDRMVELAARRRGPRKRWGGF